MFQNSRIPGVFFFFLFSFFKSAVKVSFHVVSPFSTALFRYCIFFILGENLIVVILFLDINLLINVYVKILSFPGLLMTT